MKSGRILFCRFIPFSLLGQNMHQNRLIRNRKRCFKSCNHFIYIVSIHRTDINKPHILKQHSRNKQMLNRVFRTLNLSGKRMTYIRNFV